MVFDIDLYPDLYDIASDTYPDIMLTRLLTYFLTVSLTYILAHDAIALTNLLNYISRLLTYLRTYEQCSKPLCHSMILVD